MIRGAAFQLDLCACHASPPASRDQGRAQASCKIQDVLTRTTPRTSSYSFMIGIIVKICMLTRSERKEDITKDKKKKKTTSRRNLRESICDLTQTERERARRQAAETRRQDYKANRYTLTVTMTGCTALICFKCSFGGLNRREWRKTQEERSLIISTEDM